MYGFENQVNRLPKGRTESPAANVGRTVGSAMLQAVAIVVAFRLVDAIVEIAMSRFRRPRQPVRQEEPVGL